MITPNVTSQNWGKKETTPLVKSVGMLHRVVNSINAAVEGSWTCVFPWNCLSIFFGCLLFFFWNQVCPFTCLPIPAMSSDMNFHNLNRGASASWAKLQGGRISKYFGKRIQTLFLSLLSILKGWASFFRFLFPLCWYVVGYGNCYNIGVGSFLNSIQIEISSKYGGVILDHVVCWWLNVYVCRFQWRDKSSNCKYCPWFSKWGIHSLWIQET